MRRPNILFIQSDSMDGRAMGCMNHPAAFTPTMDAIAARGAIFQQAYCPSPVCVPSRAGMWAGKQIDRLGVWNNAEGLADDGETVFPLLRQAGYRTELLGRLDHHRDAHTIGLRLACWMRSAPIRRHRKGMVPQPICVADTEDRVREPDWRAVDAACDWLRQADDQQPFFLHVGFCNPHPGAGYRTSQHYLDQIPRDRVPMPPADLPTHPVQCYARLARGCENGFSDELTLAVRHHYLAMIAEVDAKIGTLLRQLELCGLADNTVVIYLSDHGDLAGEHGLWRKSSMYEGSVRVPLIMAGPEINPGTVVDQPVSLLRVFGTLCDLAGIEPPEGLDGASLFAADGAAAGPVLVQHHGSLQNTGSFMLRDGNWKYIEYAGHEPQLFNLTEDPWEIHNLAAERQEVLNDMQAALRRQVQPDPVDAEAKRLDRDNLRTLRRLMGRGGFRRLLEDNYEGWTDADSATLDEWLFRRNW